MAQKHLRRRRNLLFRRLVCAWWMALTLMRLLLLLFARRCHFLCVCNVKKKLTKICAKMADLRAQKLWRSACLSIMKKMENLKPKSSISPIINIIYFLRTPLRRRRLEQFQPNDRHNRRKKRTKIEAVATVRECALSGQKFEFKNFHENLHKT